MPTYEYECAACGHVLEVYQSMLDKKLKKCPKCGKNTLNRLIGTGGGVIFKGSGFYETDFKRKTPSKEESPAKTNELSQAPSSCCANPTVCHSKNSKT